MSTTRTVARNTLWYGLEVGLSLVASFIISIWAARHFGPLKLANYNYVLWLTTVTGVIGTLGLSATARKYMAEYFGRGEPEMAKAIYGFTLRLQAWIALLLVTLGVGLAVALASPEDRAVACVLVLCIAPRIVAFVPSQANMAEEKMSANVPGSLVGALIQFGGTALSLWLGWDLLGVALSGLAGYSVELVLKLLSVRVRFRALPAAALPAEVRRRMFVFSGQGITLMILNIVVWDRSDMLFLKALHPDKAQVSFFFYSFNLTEKLMLLPQTVGTVMGASLMVQFGRDREKMARQAGTAGSYMLLMAIPLLAGAAALAPAAIAALYGRQYLPAIPVFMLMTLFAIPKAMMLPGQNVLQATENQGFLVWWSAICGIVNAGVDWWLIPGYGAIGAAIGNGTAQALAAIGIWVRIHAIMDVQLRMGMLARVAAASAGMALAAWLTVQAAPNPWAGLAGGVAAGAATLIVLLRLMRALGSEDRDRLMLLGGSLPGPAKAMFLRVMGIVIPAA